MKIVLPGVVKGAKVKEIARKNDGTITGYFDKIIIEPGNIRHVRIDNSLAEYKGNALALYFLTQGKPPDLGYALGKKLAMLEQVGFKIMRNGSYYIAYTKSAPLRPLAEVISKEDRIVAKGRGFIVEPVVFPV